MTVPFLADADSGAFALARIKLGRLGRPEDVIGGAAFLALDAPAPMTGAALVLDGGWTSTS